MARIERAAAVRPAFAIDGRPVAGPDEDGFTLAVAAVERLPALPVGPHPLPVDLVGEFPEVIEAGLPAALGRPVALHRHEERAAGLAEAVADANDRADLGERSLVLAVDLPERSDDPAPGEGALAIALAIGPGDGLLRSPAGGDSPLRAAEAALELRTADPAPDPGRWIGAWDRPAAPGRPIDAAALREAAGASVHGVSEGAYVPRPRYLEELPSRWRLVAERCGVCGAATFPGRGVCVRCGRRDALSGELLPRDGGTVVASTVVGRGGQPTEFDRSVEALGPYGVVLVELAPGVRGTFQVADAPALPLAIGDRVGTRLRRLYPLEGEWRYGRKAVPLGGG